MGYDLDLKNPKSFNEKLQWLKCYYRDLIMPICADKVAVRDIVAQIIGKEYLVPIYGVFNSVEEIDISKLPNSFVLKPSHSSGRVIVCTDKEKMRWHENFRNFTKKEVQKYLNGLLGQTIFIRILNKLLLKKTYCLFYNQKSLLRIINHIECETHRENFLNGLKEIVKRKKNEFTISTKM